MVSVTNWAISPGLHTCVDVTLNMTGKTVIIEHYWEP